MSTNYSILALKANQQNKIDDYESLLTRLNINFTKQKEEATFDELLNLHRNPSKKIIGLTRIENLLLISDENYLINMPLIESTSSSDFELLQVEVAGTISYEHFSYWIDGILTRKKTKGLNEIAESHKELKGMIPDEDYAIFAKGDENIGPTQWFEKQGSELQTIMKSFGFTEKGLWENNWALFEIL